MAARNQDPVPPDPSAIMREVATRKIEAERLRNLELLTEVEKLRRQSAELQQKLSLITSDLNTASRKHKAELSEAQQQYARAMDEQKAQFDHRLEEIIAAHKRELGQHQNRRDRDLAKADSLIQTDAEKIADMTRQLEEEKLARGDLEGRLKKLETATRKIGLRITQLTGFEITTPESVIAALGQMIPDAGLQVLRKSVRDLRAAAGAVERAFARAVREDAGRKELAEAGAALRAALNPPPTEKLPLTVAQLVDEAFAAIGEELTGRMKGRHYATLAGALAAEVAGGLREEKSDLAPLQRLVEIAEGTELASAARQLMKGATSHQQAAASAELVREQLNELRDEARNQAGKVKKLYAVAEQGLAGEWAVQALQAMASLQPLPRPDKDALDRKLYARVIEAAQLVVSRIDSAMNLGAEAEASLREADEATTGLEGLVQGLHELLAAARRNIMSGMEGEQDQRLRLTAQRAALASAGKRGQRAAAVYDEQLRLIDLMLNQWRATYGQYGAVSRDLDRIVASIEGQMLDINQPLESEEGKRLFQIVHDLSTHLVEYRALSVMKQRLFYHLENPKQRLYELGQVHQMAKKTYEVLADSKTSDAEASFQLAMSKLYDVWAILETARDGTASELAVASEQIEPLIADVMVWASSTHVAELTDQDQIEMLRTLAYVRRLKRRILGLHDRATRHVDKSDVAVDQFEARLEEQRFPEEWEVVLHRLEGRVKRKSEPVAPETEREPGIR
ncbi:MAG: hypothetical protein IT462_00015 [Planctomycetes bacterium]|nr:hypothetical protein [Planctomycetota bacterium]